MSGGGAVGGHSDGLVDFDADHQICGLARSVTEKYGANAEKGAPRAGGLLLKSDLLHENSNLSQSRSGLPFHVSANHVIWSCPPYRDIPHLPPASGAYPTHKPFTPAGRV